VSADSDEARNPQRFIHVTVIGQFKMNARTKKLKNMTEEERNEMFDERTEMISKHLKTIKGTKSFNGFGDIQNILDNIYKDDVAFRQKYKYYDDKLKIKINEAENAFKDLESIKNVKKLPQKTSEFWVILKDLAHYMDYLHSSLNYRVGLEGFLLEEQCD
jgi:hypothetical protein